MCVCVVCVCVSVCEKQVSWRTDNANEKNAAIVGKKNQSKLANKEMLK